MLLYTTVVPVLSETKEKSCFNKCMFATQNSIERKGEYLLNYILFDKN